MKYLFIKDFDDTADSKILIGDIVELWPETANRAVKEKAAILIPDGVDEEVFKNSIINKKKK